MDDLELPPDVGQGLAVFVEAAKAALGAELVSIILFGAQAEGGTHASSDVSLIVVLKAFDPACIDALREPLRLAHALIGLSTMFILEDELPAAVESFAVKFADIRAHHKVLAGIDPFTALAPSRSAMLTRLKQILLDFILHARERYALVSLRDEQVAAAIADAAGPLRSAAALILAIESRPAASPKAALESLAEELDAAKWREALANLSKAPEVAGLPSGVGRSTALQLIELAQAMRARAERLV